MDSFNFVCLEMIFFSVLFLGDILLDSFDFCLEMTFFTFIFGGYFARFIDFLC